MITVISNIDFRLGSKIISFKVGDTVGINGKVTHKVSKEQLKTLSNFSVRNVKYFVEYTKDKKVEDNSIGNEEKVSKEFLNYVKEFGKNPPKNISKNNKKLKELVENKLIKDKIKNS